MKAQKVKKSHSETTSKNKAKSRNLYRTEKKRAARIRRELNENWERIEKSPRYLRAVRKEILTTVSEVIEAEFMDGIVLQLNNRHDGLSYANKHRLLRHIVEKRQAKAIKRKFAEVNVGFVEAAINLNTSLCLAHINRLRHAS